MADDKQLKISIVVDGQERALSDLDKVAEKARESANPAASSNLGDLTAAASKHRENAREKAALYRQEKFLMQELADLDEKRMLAAAKRETAEASHATAATGRMASFKGGAAVVVEVATASLEAVGKLVDRAEQIDPKFGKKLREDFLGLLDLAHPLDALMKKISEGANKELDALEESIGRAKEAKQQYLQALADRDNESMESLKQQEAMQAIVEDGNQRILEQYYSQKDALVALQSGVREAAKAQIALRAQTDPNYTALQQGKDLRALDKEAAEERKQQLINEQNLKYQTAKQEYDAYVSRTNQEKADLKELEDRYAAIIKDRNDLEQISRRIRTPAQEHDLAKLDSDADKVQQAMKSLEDKMKGSNERNLAAADRFDKVIQETNAKIDAVNKSFDVSTVTEGFKEAGSKIKEVTTTLSDLGKQIKDANDETFDQASKQSLQNAGQAITQSLKDGKVSGDEFNKIIGDIQEGMRVSNGAAYTTLKQALATVKEGRAVAEANTAQIEQLNNDLATQQSQLRALKEKAERATPPNR